MESQADDRAHKSRRPAEPTWICWVGMLSSTLNRTAAAIAAVLLVLMTFHILLEIVLRFFSLSTFMADALVGYGVAAITFLAMAWALEKGSMIRISTLTRHLSPKLQWAFELFAIVSVLLLSCFLVYFQWQTVVREFVRGTVSQHYLPIPLWIPSTFFLIGLVLISLHMVVRLIRLFAVGREESELIL